MPYNLICVQTGSTLAQIKSLEDVSLFGKLFPLVIVVVVTWTVMLAVKKNARIQRLANSGHQDDKKQS